MENYQKSRVKLTNTQLNKLKFVAKNKTGAALRVTKKNFMATWIIFNNKTKK